MAKNKTNKAVPKAKKETVNNVEESPVYVPSEGAIEIEAGFSYESGAEKWINPEDPDKGGAPAQPTDPEQLQQIEVVDPVVEEPPAIDYQARIDAYIRGRRSMDIVVQRHKHGLHTSKSGVVYVPVTLFK